jgi:hypothetical protein
MISSWTLLVDNEGLGAVLWDGSSFNNVPSPYASRLLLQQMVGDCHLPSISRVLRTTCINVLPNESRVVSESSLIKNTCCTQPRMIDILSMLVVAMN